MKDVWKELYEKYEKKKKKIMGRIVTVSIIFIASVAAILYLYMQPFSDKALEKDVSPDVYFSLQESLNPGVYKIETDLSETQCYWMRSTTGEGGFVLEVREYESPSKDCIGELLNRTEIPLPKPINIVGNDCICGRKICELENILEDGITNLKIKGC